MPQIFIPIIVSGLTAIGVSAGVAAIAAPIIVGLVFFGGGLLLSRLFSQQRIPKPDDGHTAIQQTIPPRIFAYGRVRVAGYVMLLEEAAGTLYQVNAIVAHRIHGIVTFYLHDDPVALNGAGFVSDVPGVDDNRYNAAGEDDDVLMLSRLGADTETPYAEMVTALAAEDVWTNDHRGDGQASIAMRVRSVGAAQFQTHFPFGRPQPSAVIDAALVYDWRDTSQSAADSSTWVFSKNPVLCLAHFECFSEFGPQRDFDMAILPVIDNWTEEADICDELIAQGQSAVIPRYELGGWATADLDPKAIRLAMLATCDGWLCERGDGALLLRVGKYREPEVILTDDDIAGFYVQNDIANEEAVNFMAVTYTSPENNYSEVEADPFEDAEDQVLRGRRYDTTLELPWVQNNSQARRIGKREFYRARQVLRGGLDLRLSGINAIYERWIRVQSATIPGMSDVVIENRKATINILAGGFTLDFLGSGADIDDWNESEEEGADPAVPDAPPSDALPIPANVSVTVEQSGSTSVYLDVELDEPDYDGLGVVVRYRIADIGGSVPGTWVEQVFPEPTYAAGRGVVTILAVVANEEYEVEAAFRASLGSVGDWSATVSADTSEAAPGSPVNMSVLGGPSPAMVMWDNPNSTNFDRARVYRASTGSPFLSAADVSGSLFSSPNQSMIFDDAVAPGAYDWWVVAENAGGVQSTPTGPASATVT